MSEVTVAVAAGPVAYAARFRAFYSAGIKRSVFPRAETQLERFGMYMPKKPRRVHAASYMHIMDRILCEAIPQLESECKAFYAGSNETFEDLHPALVRQVDDFLVQWMQRYVWQNPAWSQPDGFTHLGEREVEELIGIPMWGDQ